MAHEHRGATAISGLGITEMGRIYGKTSSEFALDAVKLALDDSGLLKADIDGLLINAGITGNQPGGLNLGLQNMLGLPNLRLLNHMNAAGSTAAQMVQYASLSIAAGLAKNVICVFGDAPLKSGTSAGASYGGAARMPRRPQGVAGLNAAAGVFGANTMYALAAQRHMGIYGTTQDHFGAIAVAQRKWAMMNPRAQQRDPMTMEDYHNSRWIVEPFHLFDCCLVSNGAVAIIVSGSDQAKDMKQPPAYILGIGQGHPGDARAAGDDWETETGAKIAAKMAYGMAGIGPPGCGHLRTVRLLYLHRARHARRLRLLREGRRRGVCRGRQAWAGRIVAHEYRRWGAFRLLHVGDDTAERGSHPNTRPGGRTPSR